MIRHIVSWNFKEGFSPEENAAYAKKIKQDLESLRGVVPGIAELKVLIDLLPSGNVDVVLNSLFENAEALDSYQIHPEHKKAGAFIGQVMENRRCIDYVE